MLLLKTNGVLFLTLLRHLSDIGAANYTNLPDLLVFKDDGGKPCQGVRGTGTGFRLTLSEVAHPALVRK